MRKIITIALVFMATFVALTTFNNDVEAQQTEPIQIELDNWTAFNFFSNVWGIREIGRLVYGNTGILNIEIPNTDFHTFSNGGIDSEIIFRDIDNNNIASFKFEDFTNLPNPRGFFSFDLFELGVQDAHNFEIRIMQTWTTPPGGYITFMNENSFALFGPAFRARFFVEGVLFDELFFTNRIPTTPLSAGYPTSSVSGNEFIKWEDQNGIEINYFRTYTSSIDFFAVFSGGATKPIDTLTRFDKWEFFGPIQAIETQLQNVPTGSNILTIFIPRSNRLRYATNEGESVFNFTIDNEPALNITLTDLLDQDFVGPRLEQPYGLFIIDLRDIPNNPNNRVTQFGIQIYSTEPIDSAFLSYMNRNTFFEFTSELLRAQWFVGDTIFATNFFTLFPERPLPNPSPIAPLVFVEWFDDNNQAFNPNVVYTGPQRFYARFALPNISESVTTPVNPPQATPPLQAFLTGLGLFNTEGFLFLFALVIILVNFALVYYQLGLGLIIVSNIIVAGLFIFLQFLPFWASFLFVSIIVFMIMLINGGMTKYE